MQAYIAFKTDDIYVLQTKSFKDKLYRVNFRSEKILIISEVYSYFKELFKKKQIDSVLSEY